MRAFAHAKVSVPSLHPVVLLEQSNSQEPEMHLDNSNVPFSPDPVELHVSLTRPVYLRVHQREDLKRAVKAVALSHSP